MVYLVNISKEDFLSKKNKWLGKIKALVDERCPGKILPFSAEFEESLSKDTPNENSQIQKIIHAGNELLHLAHFFTVGKDEVKSWTIREGVKAP